MTIPPNLLTGVQNVHVAVPAKDFAQSRKFYEAIGFETTTVAPSLVEVRLGSYAFFLQDLYKPDWAGNFTFHLNVDDNDPWWAHIQSLRLHQTFGVKEPEPPKLMPWGLRVMHLYDPSGVTWIINAPPAQSQGEQSQQSSRSGPDSGQSQTSQRRNG